MDLFADFARMADQEVRARYPDASIVNADESILRMHRLRRRIPTVRKWNVVESKELLEQKTELSKHDRVGLEAGLQRARDGGDLFPHLSRKVIDPDYHDLMLYDWNINHFHLRTTPGINGQYKGSHHILFGFVDESTGTLFAIGVYGHEWGRQDMLTIIKRNWPELLEQASLKGVEITGGYKAEEVEEFRKIGVNPLVPDGEGGGYVSVGGGITSAGTSVEGRRLLDRTKQVLQEIQDEILAQKGEIARQFEEQTGLTWDELDIHLVEMGPRIVVRELNTGAGLCNVALPS